MKPLELGTWEPARLDEVVGLFAGAPLRWWIAGGHALELHCGRSWRDHADIDVGISRADAGRLPAVLDGWQIAVAADGELRRWDGAPLVAIGTRTTCGAGLGPADPGSST